MIKWLIELNCNRLQHRADAECWLHNVMVPLVPYKPCCRQAILSAPMHKIGKLKAEWRSRQAGSLAHYKINEWFTQVFVLSEENAKNNTSWRRWGGKLSVSTLSCSCAVVFLWVFGPQFLFSKIDIYYREQTKYVFFPAVQFVILWFIHVGTFPLNLIILLWGNGGLKSHTANSKQLWRKFSRSSLTHPERALLWLRRSSLIPTLLKTVV